MRAHATLALLLTALVGQVVGQDAEKVMDNPPGVPFKATLPKQRFFKDAELEGNAKGSVLAVATDSGNGVKFKVKFSNLPKEGGPFTYHLHAAPVPEDGNCTETLAHLDPYERGAETPCDAKDPASCEVGDLSGKHGKIASDPFEAEYIDYYASTKEGIGAFFGNRSFVLHYANKTRLTCANFVSQIEAPATNESYSAPHYLPTPTETVNPATETPSSSPQTPSGSGTQAPEPSSSETGGSSTTPNAASTLALPVHLALAGVIALALAL